ncbi:DUF4919 domain-containing protein [Dysgonomonas macrotermitis]|uniref:DUF4919 domain-containing protein n=1 Tax=Dysgonomonas macrotermitis TaxID=1346286 RepID=A0A1M5FL97_9BACT|nr:DUF4919 domain-containing protein [Dysgonomonas macrotermitis]SHF91922.1 protein of unknown function [Dysgonomonas macrotermitis]
MFKNSLIIIGLLLFSVSIRSQDIPKINFLDIEDAVINPDGNYYYPKLLERYNAFDPSLTITDYVYIYYGFAFQKDYLVNQPGEERMNQLMEKGQYEDAIAECNKILEKNPVSLEANNALAYAMFQLNKPEAEYEPYRNRYKTFVDIITQSGDGKSPLTSFKVIYVADEYNIMFSHFEIPEIVFRHQLVNAGYDYFKIKPSALYKSEDIYFEIPEKLNNIHKERAREKARKKAEQQQ